jgi:hypothetical protein
VLYFEARPPAFLRYVGWEWGYRFAARVGQPIRTRD